MWKNETASYHVVFSTSAGDVTAFTSLDERRIVKIVVAAIAHAEIARQAYANTSP
jgi:hypothetical protein